MNPRVFFLVIASVAIALMMSEGITRYTVFTADERHLGAETLFHSFENGYVQRQVETLPFVDCAWNQTLVSHPYLGWVHKRPGTKCGFSGVNNRGFPSHYDMPSRRDPNYFSILLVGGSVASHLAIGKSGGRIWLEDELNENYISPNGKPFRILQGAMGGWKFPAQNIVTLMYGDIADAVAAVDGFNETADYSVDRPQTMLVQILSRESSDVQNWIPFSYARKFRHAALGLPMLKNSYLALSIYRALIQLAYTEAKHRAEHFEKNIYPDLDNVSEAEHEQWNLKRFEHYFLMLEGEAKILKVPFAHFLQPIPSYKKNLTLEEKNHLLFVTDQHYKPYDKLARRLKQQGHNSFSLTDIFEHHDENIYSDEIHCQFDERGDSPGYALMSKAIAEDLAKAWHLKRR